MSELITALPLDDLPTPCVSPLSGSPLLIRTILVLDLDETLIHSIMKEVEAPLLSSATAAGLDTLHIHIEEEHFDLDCIIRPYVTKFLETMSKWFKEIVVFTASQRSYADAIIDHIDPNHQYISRRFYRDSCTLIGGVYKKDLRKVSTDLSHIVLVDNSPNVMMQPRNGYVCESFTGQIHDRNLLEMIDPLIALSHCDDVRTNDLSNSSQSSPDCLELSLLCNDNNCCSFTDSIDTMNSLYRSFDTLSIGSTPLDWTLPLSWTKPKKSQHRSPLFDLI